MVMFNCIHPINPVRILLKFIGRATNFGEQIYGCIESKRIGERDTERRENKCAAGRARRDATRYEGKEKR